MRCKKDFPKTEKQKLVLEIGTGDYPLTCHTLQGSPQAKAKGDAKAAGRRLAAGRGASTTQGEQQGTKRKELGASSERGR